MAFFKGSYYQNLKQFEPDERATISFRGTRARPIPQPEPVLEHSVSVADRLDSLGQHYYANPRDWRRLADCNSSAIFPEDLIIETEDFPLPDEPKERAGQVILVPRRREGQR